MEIPHILETLRVSDELPVEALASAVEQREAITPVLVEVVREAARHEYLLDHYNTVIAALYLLAQFRCDAVADSTADFLAPAGGTPEEIAKDDMLLDDLDRILASIFPANLGALDRILGNRAADTWVRTAAIDALLLMLEHAMVPREEVVRRVRNLAEGGLEREPSELWTWLADAIARLRLSDLEGALRRAYEEELADPAFMTLEEALELLGSPEAQPDPEPLIDDVVDELDHRYNEWDADEAVSDEEDLLGDAEAEAEEEDEEYLVQTAYRGPKIGRNAPCPCGSGKKYKKCCGR